MNRIDVLQKIIDTNGYKSYLEIGCASGTTILNLKNLDRVFAVDPKLRYPMSVYRYSQLRDDEAIFEMTSDDFFEQFKEKVDLVFIDGAHYFEQAVKDIENSLWHLNDGGVIVLHDCNPPHKAAAIEAKSFEDAAAKAAFGWNGEWCGDVWKVAVMYPQIKVLDCDYGIGLLKKIAPVGHIQPPAWILNLKYEDLEKDRIAMLKLKPVEYLDEFLEKK
jgi:SAM-dependent methyltransferase